MWDCDIIWNRAATYLRDYYLPDILWRDVMEAMIGFGNHELALREDQQRHEAEEADAENAKECASWDY